MVYFLTILKFISKQFENRYPPDRWNIYVFYFTDGENWGEDNEIFIQTLSEEFKPNIVNFTGITQILASTFNDSVKFHVDKAIREGRLDGEYVRTVSVGGSPENKSSWSAPSLSEENRNEQIIDAIQNLLGNPNKVTRD